MTEIKLRDVVLAAVDDSSGAENTRQFWDERIRAAHDDLANFIADAVNRRLATAQAIELEDGSVFVRSPARPRS
jgi:hypothetical protein